MFKGGKMKNVRKQWKILEIGKLNTEVYSYNLCIVKQYQWIYAVFKTIFQIYETTFMFLEYQKTCQGVCISPADPC